MKRFVEVYWTPWINNRGMVENHADHLLIQEPQPVLSEIAKERPKLPNYFRCPAFVKSCQNAFLIRSPVDVNVTIKNNSEIYTDRYGQGFYNTHIENKQHHSDPLNPFLMSAFPECVFYSNEPVEMETLDPFLLHSNVSRNVRLVPGCYDISKWVRPVEYAFEVIDQHQPLEFKVGSPLMMIRFKTKHNRPVKLVRVMFDSKIEDMVKASTTLKMFRKNLSLEKLYGLAASYLEAWRKSK